MRDFWSPSDGSVSPDAILWRYFRPKRLIEALSTSKLYFATPTEFDDKFEGAVRLSSAATSDQRPAGFEALFRNRRNLYKINCWHESGYENSMMWELYASRGRGVAIRTTLARIRRAIRPYKLGQGPLNDVLWCGKVKYIDLDTEQVPSNATPPVGTLKRMFYKHQPFASENEFRLVVDLEDSVRASGDPRPSDQGVFVEFNLEDLVEAIVVGRNLDFRENGEDKSQRDRVCDTAMSVGLADRIVRSTFSGTPRFL